MDYLKPDRRALLGAGALLAGSTAVSAKAQTSAGSGSWKPATEQADAWLDQPGTRHRMVFDTTTFDSARKGIHFATNFYNANASGYGLKPEALAVVVILRAEATALGFDDAIWAKYGGQFAKLMNLTSDDAAKAAKGNPLLAGGAAGAITLATLQRLGARYAVCGMATHGISQLVARAVNGDASAIEAEFRANLVPGALMVAAGIVAVNRAQEHGYALAYVS